MKIFPRRENASAVHPKDTCPEEPVQSRLRLDRYAHLWDVDYLGVVWLGEARWFYTKGMFFAFWASAGIWSVAFLHPPLPVTAMISAIAGLSVWMLIECGLKVQDAFEYEQQQADDAYRLWQHEDVAKQWAEYERDLLRSSRAGLAEGDPEEISPSAEILPFGRVN